MIKKMTKYSFVLFHKEVEDFLKNLQEIGVVDITRQKRAIDSFSKERFDEIASYNAAVSSLKRIKSEAEKAKVEIPAQKPSAENLLEYFNTLLKNKDVYRTTLFNLKAEYPAAAPWGAFTEENFRNLADLGFKPCFYSVSNMAAVYPFSYPASKVR